MSIYLNLVSQLLKNNDTNYTQKSHLYQRDTSKVVQKVSFCLALSQRSRQCLGGRHKYIMASLYDSA